MKLRFLFLVCTFFVLGVGSAYSQDESLKIHFIDVGEGDSILVQTPGGGSVLVDAGNLISGVKVVDYLKKRGIKNLDYLIFTHPHPDHIGGAFFVVQRIKAKKIYDNGEVLSYSRDMYRWYDELVRKKDNYRVMKAGDRFSLDGVRFEALWPPRPFVVSGWNTNSLVILVEFKSFRCLLAGDLTVKGEDELIKGGAGINADVLKVGHHGHEDAGSEAFLRAVSPEISVISVNKENIRGYPSEKVIERLKALGTQVYRTDKNSSIVVVFDKKNGIKVKTEK